MKIAVTSAFGWPYVRRGNRVVYELAEYLASHGNEVHFITTKPGTFMREKVKQNLVIKYYPAIDHPFLTQLNIEYWHTFGLTCLNALLKEDYDIVYTSLTLDTFAASINKSLTGTPFIPVLIQGEPLYKDARRAKRLFQRAIKTASHLVTISNFVNGILKRDFGIDGVMIPCPVDTSKFFYIENKSKEKNFPSILCTATLVMERKRVPLLVKAFEILIEYIPNAILQLAGETTPEVTKNLLMTVNAKTRASIVIENITSDEALVSFYRNATITALPSLKEPFGMVTTESLACGTPVVGTRSGGTAEIIDDHRVGVLFEADDGPEQLCKALIKGIELAHDPQTSRHCSQHAEKYSWNTLGPKYEEIHSDVHKTTNRKYWLLKKIVKKRRPQVTSIEKVSINGYISNSALNRFFVDTLDELEITAQTYYDNKSYQLRCVYVLERLLTRGNRNRNIMILSSYPHFLATLLKKSAFSVRHVVINNEAGVCAENGNYEILPDLQSLSDVQERFDVIICDDLFQYLTTPDETFQLFKQFMSTKGILILITPNTARVVKQFNLLTNNKIHDNVSEGVLQELDTRQLSNYREYSFAEIKKMARNAGFTVVRKSFIIGEKPIDKTVAFTHVPLKTYLSQKIFRSLERAAIPLRSYLFLVFKLN